MKQYSKEEVKSHIHNNDYLAESKQLHRDLFHYVWPNGRVIYLTIIYFHMIRNIVLSHIGWHTMVPEVY